MPLADQRAQLAELEQLGLFGALDQELVGELAAELMVVPLAAGETMYAEGDAGRAMYVVLDGAVELTKRAKNGRVVCVSVVHSGDWFGEMSLLDMTTRPLTARATCDARLLELKSGHLDRIYRTDLKAYALIVMNIARQLSRKLRISEGTLADRVATAPNPDASR